MQEFLDGYLDHGKLEVSTSDGTAHTTIPLLGRDGRPIEYTYLQHLAVGKWDIKSSKSFGFGAGDPGDLFVLSPLVLSTGPLHLPPHDVYIVPYLKRNRAAREARRQERNEGELQEAVSGAAPNPPRHRIAATWGL